jgi:hypothetical protein
LEKLRKLKGLPMDCAETTMVQGKAKAEPKADLLAWQTDLLPLMKWTLIGLMLFFFLATCVQLYLLNRSIQNAPKVDTQSTLSLLSLGPNPTSQEILAATRLRGAVTLEAANIDNQFHQGGVLLMSRVWTSYLGFVTGMILALVGAAFVLGKLNDVHASELKGERHGLSVSLTSTSPGLVLAVLGVALMMTAMVIHHSIEVTIRPLYLFPENGAPSSQSAAPPPLTIPENKQHSDAVKESAPSALVIPKNLKSPKTETKEVSK